MKAPFRTTLFVATIVLVALPVMADAPNGSDPNRKAQYAAFISSTPTIHDIFTDLVWERKPAQLKRTLAVGETNCASSFSGRLPSVKELLTIVDEDPYPFYDSTQGKTVFKAVDRDAFGSWTYTDGEYWTSTPTGNTDEFWTVSFTDGTMKPAQKTATAYVRCVR